MTTNSTIDINKDSYKFENIVKALFEADGILKSIFKTILTKPIAETKKKRELLESSLAMLNQYVQLDMFNSNKEKLDYIEFIDKLNTEKELLELEEGRINIDDLKIAGKRLGKKSQSAFENK